MLPSLPFQGTIKVINKGTDIVILADPQTVEIAFKASRMLVVRGISTAVLEVTLLDPLDTRTLKYYEETTRSMLFLKRDIFSAALRHLKNETAAYPVFVNTEEEIIEAAVSIASYDRNVFILDPGRRIR